MRSNINMQTPSHKYITVNADAKIIRAYLKSFGNRKMTRTFGRKRNKKKKKRTTKISFFPPLFDCIRPIYTSTDSTHNYKRDV
jgi:hypothetical protein